ncbi:ribosome-associated translation inhibitor RaiA [Peribacillus deserti]|uniref:Ribosome-associated translation inhibitor RaiA n=1 Tax=Peribacillus deserti TaxID=673318 RepID=A0ABS2QH48_9BACI|nr:hypothetical protein [Peribacillus deserti]MBM7692144.1 ribosome-associated translation inhibitor RaiA [Peribacillus deserti]
MSTITNSAVKYRSDLIVYHVQTNERIHLSDKSCYDILSNMAAVVEKLEKQLHRYKEDNHALRWNELRIHLERHKPEGCEETLRTMERLNRKESIR